MRSTEIVKYSSMQLGSPSGVTLPIETASQCNSITLIVSLTPSPNQLFSTQLNLINSIQTYAIAYSFAITIL